MMQNLAALSTEQRNPASEDLDQLSTLDMLTMFNDEDARVAAAVRVELHHIARAVDAISERFQRGGRLFYIGAGTSGRLGVLDASECPPTFSVPVDLFRGIIAGGDRALRLSSEHSEDSTEEGERDLIASGFGLERPAENEHDAEEHPAAFDRVRSPQRHTIHDDAHDHMRRATQRTTPDTLIGIAASGRTPYVLGALAHARSLGALTIALTCVPNSEISAAADLTIAPVTGPEVLTGSTRMKAGTATKLVLNMISTGVMVRTGAVFGNLMVNVRPTNAKLRDRAQRILCAATSCDVQTAARLLEESNGSVKTAVVMQSLKLSYAIAESLLEKEHGNLRRALSIKMKEGG